MGAFHMSAVSLSVQNVRSPPLAFPSTSVHPYAQKISPQHPIALDYSPRIMTGQTELPSYRSNTGRIRFLIAFDVPVCTDPHPIRI